MEISRKERQNKLVDTVLDMKVQVEAYSGLKINIDQEITKAEQEIKRNGGKINKKELEAVRKYIKKNEKKLNQRMQCMACYMQDAPNISFEEYEFLHCSAHKNDKDKEEEELRELPARLAIGISMILAGGFLIGVGAVLKIPACSTPGQALFWGGVNFAIEGSVNKQDEEKQKEKK